MQITWELRETEGAKCHWYATHEDGTKFSVLDCGTLMEGLDKHLKVGFRGWEAIPLKDGEMDCDNTYRADTKEELEKCMIYYAKSKS